MDQLPDERPPAAAAHPLYAQGMAYLQAGAWQKAIDAFEALLKEAGDEPAVQRALREAQFKAHLDATTRVRARRTTIPWRRVAIGVALLIVVVVGGFMAVQLVDARVTPALAEYREQRRIAALRRDGKALLEAGKLDEAQAKFEALLAAIPLDAEALAGLEKVAGRRGIDTLCTDATTLYRAGDFVTARQKFTDISLVAPGACDATHYIDAISRQLAQGDLWTQAEADYKAGNCAGAVRGYEEIKARDANYERETLEAHQFDCYLRLGRGLVEQNPPKPESVPKALDYFTQALALRPRDVDADTEQRMASQYLAGQSDYSQALWDDAAARLGAVFEQRPDYLHGMVVASLYDALIKSGDQHLGREDYSFAYDQFRKASLLPGDVVLARNRMATVVPHLTPTSTPTETPTVTPTFTPTPIPTSTPIPPTGVPTRTPLPTPTAVLATLHNQIVFFSDNEEQPGMWVMNPDGSGRRFLGSANGSLRKQYDELIKKESLSPDGRYRVYVTATEREKFPQLFIQGQTDQWGKTETRQITHFSKVCYDPVWAPNGSRIAFVSQEKGSDDLWVINPDGTNAWNYTPNVWEWDKHPSWSPDSTRIVLWSNREGTKQIYMIDADGRNLVKVSATTWDEYDPIWIK